MRPSYETSADRAREREVALAVATPRLMIPHRTPRYYPCDWVFQPMGENVREHWLVEVKIRQRAYDRYMLSLHKATTMLVMAATSAFMPVLVVAWTDKREVGVCDLRSVRMEPGIGGRKDRGDEQDVEPVVFFSRSAFLLEPFSPELADRLMTYSHA